MTDDKPLYDPELIRAIREEEIKRFEEFYRGAKEQEQRMVDWYKKQKGKQDG